MEPNKLNECSDLQKAKDTLRARGSMSMNLEDGFLHTQGTHMFAGMDKLKVNKGNLHTRKCAYRIL
jgi:hypothetical protein